MNCTRREFVSGLTLAGTAGLLGLQVGDDLQLEDSAWQFSRTAQTSTIGYYPSPGS